MSSLAEDARSSTFGDFGGTAGGSCSPSVLRARTNGDLGGTMGGALSRVSIPGGGPKLCDKPGGVETPFSSSSSSDGTCSRNKLGLELGFSS